MRKFNNYLMGSVYAIAWIFFLSSCALIDKPDPEDAEAIACIVSGGEWVDGVCFYPDPPPDPEPEPTPTPEPDPEPTPTPKPACGFPQGLEASEFTGGSKLRTKGNLVNEVMAEITGCNVGSNCPHGKSPQEWMSVVVQTLQERGECAGQHIDGHSDEIAIHTGDCVWESYHIAYFGDPSTVVWYPGALRWAYRIPSKYCEAIPEPVVKECPAPKPNRLQLYFNIKCGSRGNCDATPLVVKSCGYCDSIGMGRMGDGSIRCSCPVRHDGHADRSACEQFFVGGDPRWFCDNQEIESKVNPYKANCAGEVQLCNSDLSVCSSR
jgi:hypothetical protein